MSELTKTVLVPEESSEESSEQYNPSDSSSELFPRRKFTKSEMSDSNEESEINYEIIKTLGEGAQGKVYKVIRKSDQKIIALKVLRVNYGSEKYNQAIQEATMLEKISKPQCNPFLACYYNHYYKDGELLIESEFIEGVTLAVYSKTLQEKNDYEKLYRHLLLITKDIITGIALIHKMGIIHNDIKPENIIIDPSLTPKLVDFGLACTTQFCDYENQKVPCCLGLNGSPHYASPEMIKTKERYFPSDIWSLGMTLYYSATGTFPYNFPKDKNVMTVLYTTATQTPKLLTTNNEVLNEIVNRSLKVLPFERITLNEIAKLIQ